nr:hypothetical protein [uncultured Duganella sp.]
MDELLRTINGLRAVAHTSWRHRVRRVAVILTGSRSGSSLFKDCLAQHPGFAALDGELEPFLALTGNGFGHHPHCGSDAIGELANPEALADNIFDGLTVASDDPVPAQQLQARWRKRLLLQFPAVFSAPREWAALEASLARAFDAPDAAAPPRATQRMVLHSVFGQARWRLNYYDGGFGLEDGRPFDEAAKIEEPPFVLPSLSRRSYTEADVPDKILLFKSPADAFRPGLHRQLFPAATVQYIHLTRGYAQSVNGLIDGWLSPTGFFSHDMRRAGVPLAIGGYADRCVFGRRWWKFDLPPNWRHFVDAPLGEVCLNQWLSSHRHILAGDTRPQRVAFEQFLADPASTLAALWRRLDLPPVAAPAAALPVIMATAAPSPGRWRRRGALLQPMAARPDVRETMTELGYGLRPESWQ